MIFDTLSNLELYVPIVPQLKTVAEAMDHDNVYELAKGHYTTPDSSVTYNIIEYSSAVSKEPFQFHKNQTIVQIILSGSELFSTTWRELAKQPSNYNKNADTGFLEGEPISVLKAEQGRFAVFLPCEPYKCSSSQDDIGIKKIIFTIKE